MAANAIEAAKAAAQNAETQVPATTQPAQAPAQAAPAPTMMPSLSDMENAGVRADGYLKVNEYGLHVKGDKSKTMFQEMVVDIPMDKVVPMFVIKTNNPVKYWKTMDGVKTTDNMPWQQAIQQAQQIQADARPYPSADVPMALTEDLKSGKGDVIMEAGKILSLSLSTTNKTAFGDFAKQVRSMGYEPEGDNAPTVRAKVVAVEKENGDYTWGIAEFEALEIVDAPAQAA